MWCAEVLSSLLVKRCNSALRWAKSGYTLLLALCGDALCKPFRNDTTSG